MSDASVRTARPDDLRDVGQVQAAVWRQAYAPLLDAEVLETFRPEAFEEGWRSSLQQAPTPQHRLLVATEGGDLDGKGEAIVGFVAIGPNSDPDSAGPTSGTVDGTTRGQGTTDGEIFALAVDPAHRGSGHGSRLLNAAVDTLRAGDFTSVTAWLLADDEATRAFAEAAGLRPDGAYRDRVVSADGRTAREVRLVAGIEGPPAAGNTSSHEHDNSSEHAAAVAPDRPQPSDRHAPAGEGAGDNPHAPAHDDTPADPHAPAHDDAPADPHTPTHDDAPADPHARAHDDAPADPHAPPTNDTAGHDT
ncbi:GNAT family N-acetyltransferase [Flexivirga aerilata]|uniref:GNAT family N-acetyltransferase n=1 Tax=Flexivirga aerilata TaxID=1656889 RepID=UPI001BB11311|nr:GNAT family N-acetyltransferase [Flexivirga aerilata]